MNTPPHIQPVSTDTSALPASLRQVFEQVGSQLSSAFQVSEPGVFRGRHYGVGELVLCGGSPSPGSTVVLAARGLGRPRLGAVLGGQLLGDRGEACSEARWQVCGRVLAVLRPAHATAGPATALAAQDAAPAWVVVSTPAEDDEADQVARMPRRGVRPARRRPPTRPLERQLSLFRKVG